MWLQGLTETVLGRPQEALDSYDRAHDAFRAVGEVENELAVENLIATNEGYVGNDAAAWPRRLDLLQRLAPLGDVQRKSLILSEIARAAAQQGHIGTALILSDEMVRAANRTKNQVLISDAHLNRGLVFHLAGRREAARHALRIAEMWMGRIPDSEMRARIAANIELTAFDWRVEPAAVSIARLTDAIRFYEKTNKRYYLAQIRFRRARLLCATGAIEPCRQDLQAGIAIASSELRDIVDPVAFGTYLGTIREATDAMASLLVQRKEELSALPYVDCSRLLLSSGQRSLQCAPDAASLVSSVQQRLPADAALLEFDALDGRLLTWLITRNGIRAVVRAMPRSVEEELLAPFAAELRGIRSLVIVPDHALANVPMAALRNPLTGHYLIEDARIVVSPSAATFAASTPPAPPRGRTLIVSNAADDPETSGRQAALSHADAEAKEIEAMYGAAARLSGKEATSRRFLGMASGAGIIHFAGHAVSNREAPLFAALALQPDGVHDSGMLFARDIARASFPKATIVVLSACDAAAPAKREEGGVTNIARAFLAAGVPAVIASTSAIEDATAGDIFRRVHRKLADGVPPVDALREVQIDLIRRGAPR